MGRITAYRRFSHLGNPPRALCRTIAALLVILSTAAPAQVTLLSSDAPGLLLKNEVMTAVRIDTSIRIGSDSLDATIYFPNDAPEDSLGYPGMLFVHGFGGNKEWDTASARLWAEGGYAALCYSVRGHGRSSGESTIMAEREREDLARVVDFLRALPGVNPDRVGLQGGSQGGLHGLWAIADSLPVRAVSADVITPRWASNMLANGAIRRTLAPLLRESTVRYAALCDTLWDMVRRDDYDALFDRFIAGRDVDTLALMNRPIPLLTFLKWQDHYFTAEDGVRAFLRCTAPRRVYLGTGGHYSDEDAGELAYQWSLVGRWMDEYVRGRSTGVDAEAEVTCALSSLPIRADGAFTWTRYEQTCWPAAGLGNLRLFFHAGGQLSQHPPGGADDSVVVRNLWDSTYAFDEGYDNAFHGPAFDEGLPRDAHAFETDPLPTDIEWIGAPVLHAFLRSSDEVFPLHAQIYEVGADGEKHLVNRVNYVARHWGGTGEALVDVPGAMHAHRFTAGNRIRVELTNIDDETRPDLGQIPFVLPLFRWASVAVAMSAGHPSSIDLPVVGEPILPVRFASLRAVRCGGSGGILVEWSTASEINNYGFTVERSTDEGRVFQGVAFVPPQGGPQSAVPRAYAFVDSTGCAGALYRIRQTDLDGTHWLSESVRASDLTAAALAGPAASFRLDQNYPNPFNPSTRLSFSIAARARVTLTVYDLLGRAVERLVDGELPQGVHGVVWDASRHAAGTYFVRLEAGTSSSVRRMLLLR